MLSLFSAKGRIGRGSWWMVNLIPLLLITICIVVAFTPKLLSPMGILIFPMLVAIVWITICANVKRYHDRDKSGWWVLVYLVPIVGPIWQFIELGMLIGDEGDNRFGPPAGSGSSRNSGSSREEKSGVDLSKFDAAYFAERAAQMSAQPRQAIPVAASRNTSGPAVFGKR